MPIPGLEPRAITAVKRHELSSLLRRIDLALVDDSVLERARSTFAVDVRALDAIHVATAEVLVAFAREALEFCTHDERQSLAALSRGLDVRGAPPPLPRPWREPGFARSCWDILGSRAGHDRGGERDA